MLFHRYKTIEKHLWNYLLIILHTFDRWVTWFSNCMAIFN